MAIYDGTISGQKGDICGESVLVSIVFTSIGLVLKQGGIVHSSFFPHHSHFTPKEFVALLILFTMKITRNPMEH